MNQSFGPRVFLLALASVISPGASSTDVVERDVPSRNNAAMHEEGMRTAAARLGRDLFFDKRMSSDGTISCASCHKPELAFSDGRVVAQGVEALPGTRNTPSLLNVALNASFFWDGRRTTLEAQAIDPFTTRNEHGLTSNAQLLSIVRSDAHYRSAFKAAYSVDASAIREDHVASALASYERTLVALNSPFDRYQTQKDEDALSPAAKRGLALFTGSAGCAGCHSVSGPAQLFSDNDFHISGSALLRLSKVDLATASARVIKAVRDKSLSSALSDPDLASLGRFIVTLNPEDIGKVRTPTLRNVALTAPYMHDGSISTLKEAVSAELYSRIDGRGLAITLAEQTDLVAFLQALTSPPNELDRLVQMSQPTLRSN